MVVQSINHWQDREQRQVKSAPTTKVQTQHTHKHSANQQTAQPQPTARKKKGRQQCNGSKNRDPGTLLCDRLLGVLALSDKTDEYDNSVRGCLNQNSQANRGKARERERGIERQPACSPAPVRFKSYLLMTSNTPC